MHDKKMAESRYRTMVGNRKAKKMSEIDTEIRHITKPDANLFAELGFAPAEAARYQAELQNYIDETLALKGDSSGS